MDAFGHLSEDSDESFDDRERAPISCHETRPGKLVLTERNNIDGWIACDLAVEPTP